MVSLLIVKADEGHLSLCYHGNWGANGKFLKFYFLNKRALPILP
jgi:hypothetical protein